MEKLVKIDYSRMKKLVKIDYSEMINTKKQKLPPGRATHKPGG